MINIVVNGKFLRPGIGRSGVHRVAHEMLYALDALLVDDPTLAAVVSIRVIVPIDRPPKLALSQIRVEGIGRVGAAMNETLWEQLVLPWQARGSTLLNLCNVGPVLHRDAFTMFHDAQVHSSPESYSRPFRAWYQLIQPLLGRSNRAILTVSEYSRSQLEHHGVVSASRVSVIHNGCDHVMRLIPDLSALQAAGLGNKRYVVALANTQAHKNIGLLFQAFHLDSLKGVTLALFGAANRADFEALGHSVPPNVMFLGRLSDEQLSGLLTHATALAFPSLTEGFGLPPLEAMALGCPAIVAPCGALPEVCGDAALWAASHHPAEWASQIVRLCDESIHRSAVIARGREHAARFTWKSAANRLLAML